MKDSDQQRIEHMLRYCAEIAQTRQRFGERFEIFSADMDYFKSISMSLFQIGELVTGMTASFKENTRGQIPWQKVKAMRNAVAHGYDELDIQMIWDTVCGDIPALQRFCEEILAGEDTGD